EAADALRLRDVQLGHATDGQPPQQDVRPKGFGQIQGVAEECDRSRIPGSTARGKAVRARRAGGWHTRGPNHPPPRGTMSNDAAPKGPSAPTISPAILREI